MGVNVWATIAGPLAVPSVLFQPRSVHRSETRVQVFWVYFKEPTCSAQTSSLGEWREPVTAARAVLAVAICMVFLPSHFLQLSTCFPREIEKGQLSLFSREEAVVGCEMARGMKPFTLSGAESHILISAVCKPISSTGKTQRVAKSWSCSQARPP